MPTTFPEKYLDLFQKKAFGAFTTLMPDGSPQTTPVWVDYQGGEVWVNSACTGSDCLDTVLQLRLPFGWHTPDGLQEVT